MTRAIANATDLTAALKDRAHELGFDLVGIAPAVTPEGFHSFREWLQRGYAGEMQYLPNREHAYEHPESVLREVRSVIMLGMNYNGRSNVTPSPPHPLTPSSWRRRKRCAEDTTDGISNQIEVPARVSRYAWGSGDYHDVIRERLKTLGDFLHEQRPGCKTRGVVDTAPLLERDFAKLAGLGWFGKNTMLINKRKGSWLFLAGLLTDVELEYDDSHESSHCGTCTRCLEACPTDAFPEPYVLDARRCISYLNIELRGPIPAELRDGVGDWLFGCDICQEVCPWNNKAPISDEPAFQPAYDLSPADAIDVLSLDEEAFREHFRKTPLWRPGRSGLLRTAAIVLGNAGNREAVPALTTALRDVDPVIRGAAAWALGKLGGAAAVESLQSALNGESDAQTRREIEDALSHIERVATQS